MSEGKFDSHRRLCPDGACIGVIGDDGSCRVCGRAASGGPAPSGFAAADADDSPDGDASTDDDDDAPEPATGALNATAGGGGFDPNRRLCPDGGCIGVIGSGGVCTVCGQKPD